MDAKIEQVTTDVVVLTLTIPEAEDLASTINYAGNSVEKIRDAQNWENNPTAELVFVALRSAGVNVHQVLPALRGDNDE